MLAAWLAQKFPLRRSAVYASATALLAVLAGLTWMQSRLFANPESLFSRAVAVAPRSPDAHNSLGWSLLHNGRTEAAKQAFMRVLELKSNFMEARYNLGAIYEDEQNFAQAEEMFRQVIRLKPKFTDAYVHLGNVLRGQRKLAEAEEQYRTALRLQPGHADATMNLGGVLMMQRRNGDALAIFNDALHMGVSNPEMLNNMAWIMATSAEPQLRNPRLALEYAERALVKIVDARKLNTLAAAQAANGNFAKAIETARQAQQLAIQTNAGSLASSIGQLIPVYEQGRALTLD